MMYETPINRGITSPSDVDIFKINKNDFSIQEIEVDEILHNAQELLKNAL